MLSISQFFQKFSALRKNNEFIKHTIQSAIKEISGVEIKLEDLDLKEEKVYLKCSPIMRNQIFMYKERIEESLKEQKIFLKIL